MTTEQIIRILSAHSVPFYTENNRIYADSGEGGTELFEKVVDVTDWDKQHLYHWLGY